MTSLRNIALVLIALLLAGVEARAGEIAPQLQSVLSQSNASDDIDVIIRFRAKAEPSRWRHHRGKERRAKLIEALRAKAETSQRPTRAWLRAARSKKTRVLWAINAVAATLPANRVAMLANRPEIESIVLDSPVTIPVAEAAIVGPAEWNIDTVGAPALWNLGFDGTGSVVATLDSGVDLQHPDLGSRWRGGTNSWFDPYDQHPLPHDADGHGTGVMGVIVGGDAGGTAIGVAPGSEWIAARIFNDAGGGTLSGIHEAFQWALDPDGDPNVDDAPDVVNASWSLVGTAGSCENEFEADIALLRSAGIAVVVAAGNYGPGPGSSVSPANNPSSLPVAAVDSAEAIASFSSRGPSSCDGGLFPEVAAPGVDITTADLTLGGVFPDSYATVSGTSVAAPHVTGAVALLRSALGDLPVDTIESALRSGALDLGTEGHDNDFGWGRIDIFQSYLSIAAPGPTLSVLAPIHDARVKSSDPNSVFGLESPLWVDEGSTTYQSYLKFDLSTVPGTIDRALLRLYASNGSRHGVAIHSVSNAYAESGTPWNEAGISWANAPAIAGPFVAALSAVSAGGWVELDVTSAVANGGIVSLALAPQGTDSARFHSREGANPPELVIESSNPGPPTSDFEATPRDGFAPLEVDFSDQSSGGATSRLWDFGDGQTSTLPDPTHSYADVGSYTVTLTVTNAMGSDSLTQTDYVTVDVAPAIQTLVPSHDAQVKSTGPDSNYGLDELLKVDEDSNIFHSYLKFDLTNVTGTVGSATLRLYTTGGSQDGVAVYAVSNDYVGGAADWTQGGITWANAPTISGNALDAVASVAVGDWIELDVTAAVTGAGFVSFGLMNDGPDSARFHSREGANPPELVVEMSDPGPPVAEFDAAPQNGLAPLMVSFFDRSSGAPTAWSWDFGDGQSSTLQHPTHTYASIDTYTVTLTATNAIGVDDRTRVDYITAEALQPPVAQFNAIPRSGSVPLTVEFTDLSSGATSWTWDFGDGEGSAEQNPSHTYTVEGSYEVALTAGNIAGSETLSVPDFVTVATAPSVASFSPLGDARVKSSDPNTSFGLENPLWVDEDSTAYHSYLKFEVAGMGGTIQSAVLRLYATNGSRDGVAVYPASNEYDASPTLWEESGITWNNAPPIAGAALDVLPTVTPDQWIELDVTAAVLGNGTVSFGLKNDGSDSARFNSREGGNPPELIVRTQ